MAKLAKLYLGAKALGFACGGFALGVPGKRFDLYGRRIGLRMLRKTHRIHRLLLNPVSSVRYFEFEFAEKALAGLMPNARILDVSSPYLFGLYIATKQDVQYEYVNPDLREQEEIEYVRKFCALKGRYGYSEQDATCLPYDDETFEYVISISVVEHIDGSGDTAAMREYWRVLRPGGALVVTFPVKKSFEEEYREGNAYGLPVRERKGKYFFQRYYDAAAIGKRLLAHLASDQAIVEEFYGENSAGFFAQYEQRWMKLGCQETVKDPWLMATRMKKYSALTDINGMAVCGLRVRKATAGGSGGGEYGESITSRIL